MGRYQDKFRSITQFFRSWMRTNYPGVYVSWNDYRVVPDDLGGGISVELQWDSGPLEEAVREALERELLGVQCSLSWGRWDHQVTVHVDERACH